MSNSNDDDIFLIVAQELASKRIDEALWTKAYALENGDERKTKAHYIRLRVEQLKTAQSKTEQIKAQDTTEHSRNEQDYLVERSNKAKALGLVPATAWQRFWARSIDLLICTILVLFIPIKDELLSNIWLVVIVGFLLTGVVLVIYDGLLTSVFGATIGKMIAGIRVQKLDGSYPDFGLALRRAYNVLVSGNWLYMFYPVSQLFLWPRLHKEFKKTGTTSWDEKAGTEVIRTSNNEFRRFLAGALGVLCFISTLLIVQVIKQLNKKVIREQVSMMPAIPEEKPAPFNPLVEKPVAETNNSPAQQQAIDLPVQNPWQQISRNADSSVYVRPESLHKNGSVLSIMFIENFYDSSSRGIVEVICTQNSARISRLELYSSTMARGELIDSFNNPSSTFNAIGSDSNNLFRSVVNFVCR